METTHCRKERAHRNCYVKKNFSAPKSPSEEGGNRYLLHHQHAVQKTTSRVLKESDSRLSGLIIPRDSSQKGKKQLKGRIKDHKWGLRERGGKGKNNFFFLALTSPTRAWR